MTRELSVLDLAVAHHEATLSAFAEGSLSSEDARHVAGAASDFFLESLATFDMVQRGLGEAREAALVERRQTEMSSRLSSFLADASLPSTPPTPSRRCCNSWPSRHASSSGSTAAWRR